MPFCLGVVKRDDIQLDIFLLRERREQSKLWSPGTPSVSMCHATELLLGKALLLRYRANSPVSIVAVWMRCPRHGHLNPWPPVGGGVWRGLGGSALLELKHGAWGELWELKMCSLSSVSASSLQFKMSLRDSAPASMPVACSHVSPWHTLTLWNCQPNPFFSKLPWSWHCNTATEEELTQLPSHRLKSSGH